MDIFDPGDLGKLFKPNPTSEGENNGQVTIIGGSRLFHGAPLLSLKTASRIVDMVFFASPQSSIGKIAESIKSKLMSFIWIPWEETEKYIEKSDAVLIGPGFMRFRSEKVPFRERDKIFDEAAEESRAITQKLLKKFPNKRWVIDAGSLQVMDVSWIPKNSIITPNRKEYDLLFKNRGIEDIAKEHKCVIVLKGPETIVCSKDNCVRITNGNPGMTKGGTGDVLAGLIVALLAKNDAFLAATSGSYLTKGAGDELYQSVGSYYNADDLADLIPSYLAKNLRISKS